MLMHYSALETKKNTLWTEKKIRKWATTYYIIDSEFFIEKRDRKRI